MGKRFTGKKFLGKQFLEKQFLGYYLKHQKGDRTLCIIIGRSDAGSFLQVITEEASRVLSFPGKKGFPKGNHFSRRGIELNLRTPELTLTGRIAYGPFTPIRYDIMGPFRFLNMECRHGVLSMGHTLSGSVELNGEQLDFTGGRGYIEMDRGCSFPSAYTWIQANDFSSTGVEDVDTSIMAAVAVIPLGRLQFPGCICVIRHQGKEYRLAT